MTFKIALNKQSCWKHNNKTLCGERKQREDCRASRRRDNRTLVPRAAGAAYSSSSFPLDKDNQPTYKRVLRYPDGYERVLIYPGDHKATASLSSSSSQQATTSSEQPQRAWDIAGVWSTTPEVIEKDRPAETDSTDFTQSQEVEETASPIPNTPTELLRKQNSEEFLLSSKLEWDYAKSSFQILESCPWLESRPLWVLGTLDSGGNVQSFTLRTRLGREQMEEELESLIGKKIHVSHLTDGLITFESKGIAEYFAEENSNPNTELFAFEVESHELFQMTTEAKAVVVLMKNTKSNPGVRMLATVLRNQPKLDT